MARISRLHPTSLVLYNTPKDTHGQLSITFLTTCFLKNWSSNWLNFSCSHWCMYSMPLDTVLKADHGILHWVVYFLLATPNVLYFKMHLANIISTMNFYRAETNTWPNSVPLIGQRSAGGLCCMNRLKPSSVIHV